MGGICLGCGAVVDQAGDTGGCPECGQPVMKRETHLRLSLGFAEQENEGNSSAMPPEVAKAAQQPQNSFAGRFILVRKIGGGGMGWVWKAWEIPLARFVAIKFLKVPSGEDLVRFEREARLAAALDHPNIVPVYEFGQSRGECYLVMKFIDGSPLDRGSLEGPELLKVMIPVCQAVHHAHESGVIHRDVKPQNIMLTTDGWPFVLDFGLAKNVEASADVSVSGMAMGTPPYMSPEQAAGRRDQIDRRSDVYGLGATLYALVAGRPPFQADTPMEVLLKVLNEEVVPPRRLRPAVPAAMETIILKALEKNPEHRYATAGDLAEDLGRLFSGKTILARPPRRRLIPRIVRQNPLVSAILSAAFLAIGATLYLSGSGSADPAETARQKWWEEFRVARTDVMKNASRLETLMKRAPDLTDAETRDAAQWYRDQAALGEGKIQAIEDKGRSAWPEKREEARRLAEGARTMEGVLRGLTGEFAAVRETLGRQAERAERIAAFPGLITLRIHVFPYAALRSMKAGERWFIREGRVENPEFGTPVEPDLSTPVVIQQLRIDDYDVELVHPELGLRKLSLRKDEMRHEREFRLEGDMSAGGILKLSLQP
jgi:serine/threonine protein kinase